MKKRSSPFLTAALVIFCLPGEASIFGIPDGDTALQFQTLWQNIYQTAHLGNILKETGELAGYAFETSRAANAAVRAVKNVRYVIRNPVDFLQTQKQQFDDLFPEASDTYRDLMLLKNSVKSINNEQDFYDPYALQEAFFYARQTGKNVYEIKSRVMDRDGVSSPHDDLSRTLKVQKEEVDEIFNDLERTIGLGQLTPQEAVVIQARAAAQQARATVIIASHQNEMARLAKIQYNNSVDEEIQEKSSVNRELNNLRALVPRDLSLKPWK